jgi:hypothetical protein
VIHAILERVQKKWASVIPDNVVVKDEYSVYRLLRRGATAEAQNAQIPTSAIEANNRWRKHARSRGITPGMSMMERYTGAKASVPSLIRFSGGMWIAYWSTNRRTPLICDRMKRVQILEEGN